jgi:hypothetical protein
MAGGQSPGSRPAYYQRCLDLVHQASAHLREHPSVRDVEIMPSTLGEGISCRIWLKDRPSSRPLPDGLDLDALRLRIECLAACRGSVLATSPDTPRASLVWLF